jgi:hypothetical protein
MRTTLDIADDVLLAAKERARREKRTVGQVLSELARRALTSTPGGAGPVSEGKPFYGFAPLPHRGPAVSNELIDRLREEESD